MNVSQEQELLDWLGQPCWFCGKRPPVHGLSRVVKMLKATGGAGGGLEMLHSAVAVPRCAECHAGHRKVNMIAFGACGAGALAVFLVVVVWAPIDMAGWLKAVLVLFGAGPGGFLVGGTAGLPPGQRPETAVASFTGVEAMKKNGWGIDDPTLKGPGSAG